MSHSTEIAASPDDAIYEYPPRESGKIDFRMGKNVSVTFRGGDSYICNTCSWPDNYAKGEHKGCAHILRLIRYREEHP